MKKIYGGETDINERGQPARTAPDVNPWDESSIKNTPAKFESRYYAAISLHQAHR